MAKGSAIKDLHRELLNLQKKYVRTLPVKTRRALGDYQEDGSSRINPLLREMDRVSRLGRKYDFSEDLMDSVADNWNTSTSLENQIYDMQLHGDFGSRKMDKLRDRVSSEFWDNVNRIDDAIEGAPTVDETLYLYRAMPKDFSVRKGRNPSFMSTSLDPRASLDVYSALNYFDSESARLMELVRPRNRSFLIPDANPMSPQLNMDEMEVLLPRGVNVIDKGTQKRMQFDTGDPEWNDPLIKLVRKYEARKRGGLVHGNA